MLLVENVHFQLMKDIVILLFAQKIEQLRFRFWKILTPGAFDFVKKMTIKTYKIRCRICRYQIDYKLELDDGN